MKLQIFLVAAIVALVGLSVALHRTVNPRPPKQEPPPPPPASKPMASLEPGRVATVKTSAGEFRFVLYEKDMPVTCKNFCGLVEQGFYKGLKFHRVEDWVVQGGDPKGDGTGGSEKTIKLETKDGLGFGEAYMVGMARADDPDSASSQFFITKEPVPQLSGRYAAFGRVLEGSDIIDKMEQDDVIQEVTLSAPTAQDLEMLSQLQKPAEAPAEHQEDHDGHNHQH